MGKYYVRCGEEQVIFDRKSVKQAAIDFLLRGVENRITEEFDDFVLVSERGFRVGRDFSEVTGDGINCPGCILAPNEIAVFSAQQLLREMGVN